MERLYQIISRHFSQSEIAILASDLGIYVPSNADPNSMARELFSGARRNLRLDVLFEEVYRRKADLGLDLQPNLYELIAGTFNEGEAAELSRNLGFDRLNVGLNANSLIGWNNDDFFKNRKAQLLQQTAEKEDKFADLLVEMQRIRPNLQLTIFGIVEARADESGTREGVPLPKQAEKQAPSVVYHIYGDNIAGDKVGSDKVGGDKVGGDKVGGDKAEGNLVKDVAGDVNIGDQAALLDLIQAINQDLAALQSELRERDAQEAAEDMQDVVDELQTENPDGNRIARKLNNVAQIAGAAGAAATAANQLGPHIQQAIQMAQSLFGG